MQKNSNNTVDKILEFYESLRARGDRNPKALTAKGFAVLFSGIAAMLAGSFLDKAMGTGYIFTALPMVATLAIFIVPPILEHVVLIDDIESDCEKREDDEEKN